MEKPQEDKEKDKRGNNSFMTGINIETNDKNDNEGWSGKNYKGGSKSRNQY